MGVCTVHGCVQYMGKNGKCIDRDGDRDRLSTSCQCE